MGIRPTAVVTIVVVAEAKLKHFAQIVRKNLTAAEARQRLHSLIEAMDKAVRETLDNLDITDMTVSVQDNGALDLVLKARVEAAVARLKGGEEA